MVAYSPDNPMSHVSEKSPQTAKTAPFSMRPDGRVTGLGHGDLSTATGDLDRKLRLRDP